MYKYTVLTHFCVLSFGYVSAQEHESLNPTLDAIGFLVGDWNVTVETRLSAAGPWETTGGIAEIVWSTGSTVLDETFTDQRDDRPYFTNVLLAYNRVDSTSQRMFEDSEHGTLIQYTRTLLTDSLVFDKLWTYSNGRSVHVRVINAIISEDEFSVENMRRIDESDPWDTTGRMRYGRMI